MIFITAILILLYIYLSACVLYMLLFSVGGALKGKSLYTSHPEKKKIIILIPAYKEDKIIIDTALKSIEQDYPDDAFDVAIIADQLKQETLDRLNTIPVKVIQVSFAKSTKAKSIQYALQLLPDNMYDVIIILDADNIMDKSCLDKVNHAYHKGFRMIQLHRTAKNKNTPTAMLDAISEEINNHIFRKGHRALGLSSALIGSGMAFDYKLFKETMSTSGIENNPGEDREIFLTLCRKGYICEYIEDAYVLDEKVQGTEVLETQRTRWISAQLQYLKRLWINEFRHTATQNIHYVDFALQTLLLPRILLLFTTSVMAVLSIPLIFLPGLSIYPGPFSWMILFILCIISFALGAYGALSFRDMKRSLAGLPAVLLSFFRAFGKSSPNQNEFIHTPKHYAANTDRQ